VIWKDVMELNDNIRVDYATVEQLFASNTIKPKEAEEKKKPTEVLALLLLISNILQISTYCTYDACCKSSSSSSLRGLSWNDVAVFTSDLHVEGSLMNKKLCYGRGIARHARQYRK